MLVISLKLSMEELDKIRWFLNSSLQV